MRGQITYMIGIIRRRGKETFSGIRRHEDRCKRLKQYRFFIKDCEIFNEKTYTRHNLHKLIKRLIISISEEQINGRIGKKEGYER